MVKQPYVFWYPKLIMEFITINIFELGPTILKISPILN